MATRKTSQGGNRKKWNPKVMAALGALSDVHKILKTHVLTLFPEDSDSADRIDRMFEDIGVLETEIIDRRRYEV